MARATARRGYLATVNGDRLRLTYRYGSRYEKSGYEPSVHSAVVTHIEPGEVVIDIGAHVGFFALAAALRVGPSGHVYAFEPSPDTAKVLRRHVAMNGWESRVEVIEAVVTDEVGMRVIFTHGETMAAALFSENIDELSPELFTTPALPVEVPSVTLDDFCAERGIRPNCVKIDVEGAEVQVLRGASAILSSVAEIVCEIHPGYLPYFSSSESDLRTLAESGGRIVERIDDPNAQENYHAMLRPIAG